MRHAPHWLTSEGSDLDVGLQALRAIHTRMQTDPKCSVLADRSFRWWMKDFAQEISVSAPFESEGVTLARLEARTPVASLSALTAEQFEGLSSLNAYAATLSAITFVDNTIAFVSTAHVSAETVSWLPDHFTLRAAIQAEDGESQGARLAEMFGAAALTSAHPTSGPRPEHDPLVFVIDGLIAPEGEKPSVWVGESMRDARALLDTISLLAKGDDDGLVAEFPYGEFTSLLQFSTGYKHPQVGHGLHVTLRLPSPPLAASPQEAAALLNARDAAGDPLTALCGAWCVAPGDQADVAFTAFFPNVCHRRGLAGNIAVWMRMKADWVTSLIDARSLEEQWRQAKPSIASLLEKEQKH